MKHQTEIAEGIASTRQTSVGWLVQRLAKRFEHAMAEALRDEDLTLAQFAILMRVLETDGQTQTEIGAFFAMPAWQISRALDHLQAAGKIERRDCDQSRRVHRIHATERALESAPRLRVLVETVNGQVLASLAPEKRAVLEALLRDLIL